MFSRFSIRGKIVAVILILLTAMTTMGLLALKEIREINSRLVEVQNNWLQGILALGELQTTILRYQTAVRDHLLADDPSTEAQIEQNVQRLESNLKGVLAKYEALKTSSESHETYNELKKTWADYAAAGLEVLTASRNQDFATGRQVFTDKLLPLSTRTDELLDKERMLSRDGADIAVAHGLESYKSAVRIVALGVLLTMLLGAVIAYRLLRDVSGSIGSIVSPMRALGHGNLDVAIERVRDRTEIGEMARALEVFKAALVAKKATDDAMAAEAQTKVARAQRIDNIVQCFESMIGKLVSSLSSSSAELETAANSLTATAEMTGRVSGEAAGASQEISTNVQTAATAIDKITSSSTEISLQVLEASRVAGDAVKQAENTDSDITRLSASAQQIGHVIKLIGAIAEQTNLLALNATIEAARAGEAGRGFAVVASEVKALAAQTAKATEEIGGQITEMQAATNNSVAAIKDIGTIITQISGISATISAAVEAQRVSTQEIASHIQHAAHRSGAVVLSIGDVSRGANETETASCRVLEAARSLSSESGRLKSEVQRFLADIEAA